MLRRLFCYGTLQSPAVMAALLGRNPLGRTAILPRHRLGRLAGRPWLGIAAAPAESISGTLYDDLTPTELRRLDRYEGADYRRGTVRVQAGARQCRSWVYLPRRPVGEDAGVGPSAPAHGADWRALGIRPPRRPLRASKSRPR